MRLDTHKNLIRQKGSVELVQKHAPGVYKNSQPRLESLIEARGERERERERER